MLPLLRPLPANPQAIRRYFGCISYTPLFGSFFTILLDLQDNLPICPYPLDDVGELLLGYVVQPLEPSSKIKARPKSSSDWCTWIDKLQPHFEKIWKHLGYYFPHWFACIGGETTILLDARDPFLPAHEVSSTLHYSYHCIILRWFRGSGLPSIVEHIDFLWVLISQYIIYPLFSKPSIEILPIARAMVIPHVDFFALSIPNHMTIDDVRYLLGQQGSISCSIILVSRAETFAFESWWPSLYSSLVPNTLKSMLAGLSPAPQTKKLKTTATPAT
ncbi:conserved hypothetical protein [Ricinus communis]|uniref:Aminotransferase-like plant mobile domain-containing protein n=1 Tax=Ricinus communis TaxID=3988 RepID=B9S5A7_RICCO|nr:conserved hypothetical protein [Ricinus communis]